MTLQTKETAEKKLLKMIESSSKSSGLNLKSEKISALRMNATAVLKISNKILFLGVFVALIIFFNEVRVGADFSGKDFQVSGSILSQDQNKNFSNAPAVPELAFYIATMKDRNIFTPFEKGPLEKSVDTASLNRNISQKMKSYKLVGISWLDSVDTASVMLENVTEKKTYFLQKGEKVGDIIVKTIYADSVALGYENEEIIIGYDKTQR